MPFDGSGNFNRTFPPGGWQGDAAGAIKIRADRHDQHDADLAAGLSNAICRDGQSQVTANIPFNTKKITNLGTPTAPTDAATKAYVDSTVSASSYVPPIGGGMEFWGVNPPPKWLLADGRAISRATYSALFAILGTAYGAGDASTTFNLPDVRGRTIAGKDNMGGTSADRLTALTGGVNGDVLGAVGGAESHVLTEAQMPEHTHTITSSISGTATGGTTGNAGAHTHQTGDAILSGSAGGSGMRSLTSDTVNKGVSSSAGAHEHAVSIGVWTSVNLSVSAGNKGSGTAHNNVQPTIVANYIIYTGV